MSRVRSRIAFALLLALCASATPAEPSTTTHWRALDVGVNGPYVDAITAPDGSVWLSSAAFEGFIHVPASGSPQLFRTPGFTPSYLTYGQDGRIWSTDTRRPRAIGVVTTDGQLTVYVNRPGLDRIPAAKIQSLTDEGLTHVPAAAHLLEGFSGYFFGFAYPTGLTRNHDIAITRQNTSYVYVTECCLPGAGAVDRFDVTGRTFTEYALPYPDCSAPAGLAYSAQGYLYVPCAGKSDALLVVVNASTGAATSTPFPGRYFTRVNTVAVASDGDVYFTPGDTARLVQYQTAGGQFKTIKTPDNIIPKAISPGPGSSFLILARGRKRVYEYTP